jgi:hypothetical protein
MVRLHFFVFPSYSFLLWLSTPLQKNDAHPNTPSHWSAIHVSVHVLYLQHRSETARRVLRKDSRDDHSMLCPQGKRFDLSIFFAKSA